MWSVGYFGSQIVVSAYLPVYYRFVGDDRNFENEYVIVQRKLRGTVMLGPH